LRRFKYDVAVSYAGEQLKYVRRVVNLLQAEAISVFFAPKEQERLVATDILEETYQVYKRECRYIALFISKEYLNKDITMHEANIALFREEEERDHCIIPIYFGEARLEGINKDLHFFEADTQKEVYISQHIANRLRYHKKIEGIYNNTNKDTGLGAINTTYNIGNHATIKNNTVSVHDISNSTIQSVIIQKNE
jgi:hypothetical protein